MHLLDFSNLPSEFELDLLELYQLFSAEFFKMYSLQTALLHITLLNNVIGSHFDVTCRIRLERKLKKTHFFKSTDQEQ